MPKHFALGDLCLEKMTSQNELPLFTGVFITRLSLLIRLINPKSFLDMTSLLGDFRMQSKSISNYNSLKIVCSVNVFD